MRASRLARPSLAPVITTACAFAVYVLSLAPDLTWAYHGADGAELITAAVTLGVPHPPGYPVYVLLGKLISLLPLGAVAFRFNLLSAISMALAAGLISGVVATGLGRNITEQQPNIDQATPLLPTATPFVAAISAGLCFAFLPLVWKQAVIAEVYALNMVFVSLALWFMFRQQATNGALLLGLALGLAVTTHLTSLLLFLPALIVMQRRRWVQMGLGTVAGLSPFLILPLLASGNSPVVWGRLDAVAGWWWLVSARLYQPNVFSLPVAAWRERLITWSNVPALWLATALVVFFVVQHRSSPRHVERRFTGALLLAAALYFAYAFGYDAPDALVTLLPALAILCLLAGLSIDRPNPVLLFLPLALLVLNFQEIDLSNHAEARSLAESPLREAPQDAIIITTGDFATFSLWYLQHVEGQRSDVVIIDSNLLAFDWYRSRLAHANPSLQGLEQDDLPNVRRLNEVHRPWCELQIDGDKIIKYRCNELTT